METAASLEEGAQLAVRIANSTLPSWANGGSV
jgi:hypothetical protein